MELEMNFNFSSFNPEGFMVLQIRKTVGKCWMDLDIFESCLNGDFQIRFASPKEIAKEPWLMPHVPLATLGVESFVRNTRSASGSHTIIGENTVWLPWVSWNFSNEKIFYLSIDSIMICKAFD